MGNIRENQKLTFSKRKLRTLRLTLLSSMGSPISLDDSQVAFDVSLDDNDQPAAFS